MQLRFHEGRAIQSWQCKCFRQSEPLFERSRQMSNNVVVQKAGGPAAKEKLPVFEEIGKRIDEVKHRAFNMFERRGGELGRALEDWLAAEREIFGATSAELTETDQGYDLRVTLPGFEAKDVEVTVAPAEIVVHAAATQEKKSEEGKML